MHLPEGHQAVMPYLILNDATAFISFVQTVFSKEVTLNVNRLRDDNHTVMHSELRVNGSTIMCCDATEQWKAQPANLFVYVDNADEKYHAALKAGGKSVMELTDQDYGRTCGIEDPTGNVWWITSINQS